MTDSPFLKLTKNNVVARRYGATKRIISMDFTRKKADTNFVNDQWQKKPLNNYLHVCVSL